MRKTRWRKRGVGTRFEEIDGAIDDSAFDVLWHVPGYGYLAEVWTPESGSLTKLANHAVIIRPQDIINAQVPNTPNAELSRRQL